MKVFAILALAFTAVSAQVPDACRALVSKVPDCGRTCIDQAALAFGCTQAGDLACLCSNMADIQGPAVSCVAKACPADAIAIQNASSDVCACVKKG